MTTIPSEAAAHWPSYGRVFRYCAIAVATLAAPVLVWKLSDVILLTVGAVLFATLLRVVGEPLERWTPLPEWLRLLLAGLVVLGIVGFAGWLFGTRMTSEFSDIAKRASVATGRLRQQLEGAEFGRYFLQRVGSTDISVTSTAQKVLSAGTSVVEALVVILISAVYLVAQPRVYRDGIVLLFPPRTHDRIHGALDEIGRALRLWLIGQLAQMAIIGTLSFLAVWMIGLPSIWALALIAFVCEFIPYLGPILAAVPAILVALTRSPEAALWTVGAYLAIHQIEGNLVTPLIQRWLIVIPPALMLIGIASVGVLFGFSGIVFAGPIVAVVYVGVRQLYVRDTLDEEV